MRIPDIALALAVSAGFALSTSCSEPITHESIIAEMLAARSEMADVLQEVKDEPGWEKAKPRLYQLKKRMDAISARYEELGPAPKETDEALAERFRGERDAINRRLRAAEERLQDQEFGRTLRNFLDALPGRR